MSWDGYIQNLMAPSGSEPSPVRQAAICGIKDMTTWAASPGFTVSAEEIKKILNDRKNFAMTGCHVGGMKCMLLRDLMDDENEHKMNLRTSKDAEGNAYGVCVGKSLQALVIVIGTKEANGGQLATRVHNMTEYLKKASY